MGKGSLHIWIAEALISASGLGSYWRIFSLTVCQESRLKAMLNGNRLPSDCCHHLFTKHLAGKQWRKARTRHLFLSRPQV